MTTSVATVLIVDDFPANRDMLARRVEQLAHRYDTAENGVEALEKLTQTHYDLVLLDLMMPYMNGFEVLAQMQATPHLRHIPVIIISAADDMQNVVKAIELGAEDFLTKPFNATLLKARISSSLEKKFLREAQMRHLHELNQAKDQFVSIVSHDLRNPLTSIKGYAELLNNILQDPKQQDFAGRIVRGANRMLSLINDLLDLAKIEAGMTLQLQDVALEQFLQERLEEFEFAAQQKNITLSTNWHIDDVWVRLDPQRFAQAINNLIGNAIKYTPDGGQVELTAYVANNELIIQVVDSGLGIPAEDVAHLFDRFYRVTAQGHMQEQGTGLGLAIVQATIEAHQGHISVSSELGQGTTFTITLRNSLIPTPARIA